MEKYKFAIVGEATLFPGYTTEKILDAFAAHTIPIYVGDPLINRTFNAKAFIDVRNFPDDESLLHIIKKIDTDRDLYLKYLQAQKYASRFFFSELMNSYEKFLVDIFSLPSELAIRRPTQCLAGFFENWVRESSALHEEKQKSENRLIKKVFRRLKLLKKGSKSKTT